MVSDDIAICAAKSYNDRAASLEDESVDVWQNHADGRELRGRQENVQPVEASANGME